MCMSDLPVPNHFWGHKSLKTQLMWLSIGKSHFKIGYLQPETIPYSLTKSKTLPLYDISIKDLPL